MRRLPWALLLLTCAAASADGEVTSELKLLGDAFRAGEPREQLWTRGTLRYSERLSRRIIFAATPVVEWDSHGDVGHEVFDDDRSLARSTLRLERLSLRLELGSFETELGFQPLVWRRTDGVNPVDNLTPRDWTDPLHEERLSPLALRVGFERGRWNAELAVVPRYAPSRLPQLGGRWFPARDIGVENPLSPLSGPPELTLDLGWADAYFPATTVENAQRGLRGGYRGARAEWSLSYFRGFDDAPRIGFDALCLDPAAGTATAELTRRFPELEVVGLDAVLLAGRWALRAEAGHFRYLEDLDDDYLLYELEAEWTRGDWRMILGFAELEGADSAATVAPASGGAATPLAPPSQDRTAALEATAALDQAALPALFFHASRAVLTGWEAGLEAVLGTDDGDSMVRLSASCPLSHRLRIGVELDLLDGPSDSFYGQWRHADRLRLILRFST